MTLTASPCGAKDPHGLMDLSRCDGDAITQPLNEHPRPAVQRAPSLRPLRHHSRMALFCAVSARMASMQPGLPRPSSSSHSASILAKATSDRRGTGRSATHSRPALFCAVPAPVASTNRENHCAVSRHIGIVASDATADAPSATSVLLGRQRYYHFLGSDRRFHGQAC